MNILPVETWLATKILDEDDLSSESGIHLATQASVKRYIDNSIVNNTEYITTVINEVVDPDTSEVYAYIDAQDSSLIDEITQGDADTLTAANEYTDTQIAEIPDGDVTTAQLNSAISALEITIEDGDTNVLSSAEGYTDTQIAALPFDFSEGYLQYTQDLWYALPVPVTSVKIKKDIKDPSFEKFTDNGAGSDGVYTYTFSGSSEEEFFVNYVMDTRWRPGTDIYPAVRWQPKVNGGAGERIQWGFEYHVRDFMDPMGNSTIITTTESQPDEDYVAGKLYVNIFHPIDMSSYSLGSLPELAGRFFRAGNVDTYDGDAYLFCFGFIYRIFRPGCLIDEFPVLYGEE